MKSELLLTTVVGSYPQPDWLVNRENLKNRLPPRVRVREIWRVEERFLVRDVEFARRNTDRRLKVTLPGPFTIAQQAQNDYYPDDQSLAMDIAAAVNAEIRDLRAAGADVVQLDEPYLQARPEKAKAYALAAINRALEGVEGDTALHTCFGYAHIVKKRLSGYSFLTELNDCLARQLSIEAAQPNLDLSILAKIPRKTIMLGVINLDDMAVETPEIVAARIRNALRFVPPDRLIVAPDCGMKYLPREVAFGKLKALVEGAGIVRGELR